MASKSPGFTKARTPASEALDEWSKWFFFRRSLVRSTGFFTILSGD
jgi:hypothetical protein